MTPNENPTRAPGKWPGYWWFKRLRRGSRRKLGAWLSGGKTEPPPLTPLDPDAIRRVLVCRVNRRLGNMLFLTPLVCSLAETLPGAEIDVVVKDPAHADLFRSLPGVKEIHAMPQRSWLWPFHIIAFFYRLRRRSYDLAVDPMNHSVSNRGIAKLAGPRWTLGFWVMNQILGTTHAVMGHGTGVHHETLRPLVLLRGAFPAARLRMHENMELALSKEELAEGMQLLTSTLGGAVNRPVLGFFTEATGKKRVQPEWWQAWLTEMRKGDDAPRLLQILPPGPVAPLAPDLPHVCCAEHRRLAALLAQLDLFVCADAGPLHLGVAAGATVAGLFVRTDPVVYGPRGAHDLTLQLNELTPESAARAVRGHLAGLKQ